MKQANFALSGLIAINFKSIGITVHPSCNCETLALDTSLGTVRAKTIH